MNPGQILGVADKLWTILLIIIASYLVCEVNGESLNLDSDKDALIDNIKEGAGGRLRRTVQNSRSYQDLSVWSEWTLWSECSRSCGGGAAFRTRHCTSKIPSTYMADRPPICAGPTHEYTACNTEECPPGAIDFRATQCSVFNNKEPLVIWIPLPSYGCELLCQTLDGLYMLNFGRALDGTECLTAEENKQGMCISSSCVRVGCDGVLNSETEVDACGICGGWNHTCGHVKMMFRDALPASGYYTYNSIATIPSGATDIRITDVSGLNYLALRDEYDHFVLNGDWVIEWPGEYNRLGTSINYERHRNGTEVVKAPGPTDKDVQIMIIFREENPGVEYEYWSYPQNHARHRPSGYHTGELSENEIVGRHELPSLTSKPTTPPTTTTELPTTTKLPPTTPEMRKPPPSKDKDDKKDKDKEKQREKEKQKEKERDRRKQCGKCQKVRNRVKNYCKSDFVLQVKILGKTREGKNELKFDVEIISTYKNTMHLGHREYLWVPNRCNCPKLRPGRQYLVTGTKRYYAEIGESKLVVDRDNLVNSWKEKLHDKWDKIQADALLLCDSDTRTE